MWGRPGAVLWWLRQSPCGPSQSSGPTRMRCEPLSHCHQHRSLLSQSWDLETYQIAVKGTLRGWWTRYHCWLLLGRATAICWAGTHPFPDQHNPSRVPREPCTACYGEHTTGSTHESSRESDIGFCWYCICWYLKKLVFKKVLSSFFVHNKGKKKKKWNWSQIR